jgi:hypothetical protein
MKKLTDSDIKRFEQLKFWYLEQVGIGIYQKKYAKTIAEKGTAGEILEDGVAFRSLDYDHRCVVPFSNILMSNK